MDRLTPGLIAELACAADSWTQVERSVIELLQARIGADTLFFADEAGPTDSCVGVMQSDLERVRPIWSVPDSGQEMLTRAALGGDGVVIDVELFGSELKRMPFYKRLMLPMRGHSTLIGVLSHRGQARCKLALGRCEGSQLFTARDRALFASLIPTLTLAAAAHQRFRTTGKVVEVSHLTHREQEVLSFLQLGYTNQQIGHALGTAERTVRNQLSRVYAKLGVSNRAEAVGLFVATGGD